ncbi:MAG: hypothetical protein ACYCX7_01370 [Solirubrobacteraceae bacterium]
MSRAFEQTTLRAVAADGPAGASERGADDTRSVLANRLQGGRPRRRIAVAGALLAALALSACGSANMRETTGTYSGENGAAAPYLNVGSLVYQVQISRSLNPWENEDAGFLEGLPNHGKELSAGEEWFGVFLQVYNETKSSQPDATEVTLSDTEGHVYHPVMPNATNEFVYRPGQIPQKGQVPALDAPASYDSAGGALLIYKIKLESLENRPIRIKIANPEDPSESASAELDV